MARAGEETPLSQHTSFVICDPNIGGSLPLRYVSQGFTELFGFSGEEAIGQRFDDLVGGPSMLSTGGLALAEVAEAAGLSVKEAWRGIDFLTEVAAKQANDGGRALVLNRRKDGDFFTCELVNVVNQHPGLSWPYFVGLHRDVSDQVPVKDLLVAAARGTYDPLVEGRGEVFQERLAFLRRRDSTEYMNDRAGEMWQQIVSSWTQTPKGEKQAKKSRGACSIASRSTAASHTSRHSGMSVSTTASWQSAAAGAAVTVLPIVREAGAATPTPDVRGTPCGGFHLGALFAGAAQCSAPATSDGGACQTASSSLVRLEDSDDWADELGRFFDLLEDCELPRRAGKHCDVSFETPRAFEAYAWQYTLVARSADQENTSEVQTPLVAEQRGATGPALVSSLQPKAELRRVVDFLWRKEVYDLDFPLIMIDPSLPGCPIVGCSAGFSDLAGYSAHDTIGEDARTLLTRGVPPCLVNETACTKVADLFAIAATKKFMPRRPANLHPTSEAESSSSTWAHGRSEENALPWWSQLMLPEGEVVCHQTNARKSGELFRSMMTWKQVELDEKHLIILVQTRLLDPEIDPEECDRHDATMDTERRWRQAFRVLSENLDITEQVLASQYWYSAPMRRQTVCDSSDDSGSGTDC